MCQRSSNGCPQILTAAPTGASQAHHRGLTGGAWPRSAARALAVQAAAISPPLRRARGSHPSVIMKRNAHCLSVPRLVGYAAMCAAARSAGCDECVRATGALVASSVAGRPRPLPRPRPPRCRAPAPDRQAHGAARVPLQCAAAARRQRARLAGSAAWSGPPGGSAVIHFDLSPFPGRNAHFRARQRGARATARVLRAHPHHPAHSLSRCARPPRGPGGRQRQRWTTPTPSRRPRPRQQRLYCRRGQPHRPPT